VKLVLGTAQFGFKYGIANSGSQVTGEKVNKILECARAGGIDMIDTAIAYGESEKRLGEADISGWQIISKLPPVPDSCSNVKAWISTNVDLSLARLGVSGLYGILLHRPRQLLGANGMQLYQALTQLKAEGKVKKIGISIYEPSELDDICRHYVFDLIQAPLNVFDRRLVDSGWLQRLHTEGIEVHTRSAFLQGLLLMPRIDLPLWFEQWPEVWTMWYEWLARHNVSALQVCLLYPLSLVGVHRVVIGVDSPSQLTQIISTTANQNLAELPDFQFIDENILNPSRWLSS